MIFTLSHDDLLAAGKGHHEVLVVLVADGYDGSFASTSELAACMAQAAEQGHLRTEAGKRLDVYRPEDAASGRVVILGVGRGRAADIQEPLQKLVRELAPEVRSLAVCFAQDAHPEQLQAAMLAVARGGYLYGDTKPSAKAGIEKVALGAPNAHSLESAWAEGQALVAGVELARGWGNRPANHATPSQLADAAQDIVRQGNAAGGKRFACQILDQAQVEKLGMGAFLAVAKGSEEPLRFIVLEYRGANKADAPLVFVGKGITFDSGGISLK
ncbi:MAG: leucyl aminopeptidase, partial [Brachymonas sp.]